jgi:hypothetical protein
MVCFGEQMLVHLEGRRLDCGAHTIRHVKAASLVRLTLCNFPAFESGEFRTIHQSVGAAFFLR